VERFVQIGQQLNRDRLVEAVFGAYLRQKFRRRRIPGQHQRGVTWRQANQREGQNDHDQHQRHAKRQSPQHQKSEMAAHQAGSSSGS
jgi:hypothetical protein